MDREGQLLSSIRNVLGPKSRGQQVPVRVGPSGEGGAPGAPSSMPVAEAERRMQELQSQVSLDPKAIRVEDLPDPNDLVTTATGAFNAQLGKILNKVNNPWTMPQGMEEAVGSQGVEMKSPRMRAIHNLIVNQYESTVQQKLFRLLREYAGYRSKKSAMQAQSKLTEILGLYAHLASRRAQLGIMSRLFEVTTPKEYRNAVARAIGEIDINKLQQMLADPNGMQQLGAIVQQKLNPIFQQYNITEAQGSNEILNELTRYAVNLIQQRTGVDPNANIPEEERSRYIWERMEAARPLGDVEWMDKFWNIVSNIAQRNTGYKLTKEQLENATQKGQIKFKRHDHNPQECGVGANNGNNYHPKCQLKNKWPEDGKHGWGVIEQLARTYKAMEAKGQPTTPTNQPPQAPTPPAAPEAPQPTQTTQPPAQPGAAPVAPTQAPAATPSKNITPSMAKELAKGLKPKKGSIAVDAADRVLNDRRAKSKPWYRREH